ncbi:glycosyltransferase [Pseudomonas sp. PDM20]|uniref:glycosyltransferase n=1 Tax=Pseudomonas sp. PDM20 TaxID=2769254 RepID=UPI001784B633|nr:glycosyltransferase [Pseudomonas sp. PDM20]MBD9683204.1 glycosyltransferase [Pseudomonas sp. PDM20]
MRREPLNAVFLVRDDFHEKFGGDTFQIQNYINNTRDIAFKILTLAEFRRNKEKFDAYIITNIDRSFEVIEFHNALKSNFLLERTFVLTIHHDFRVVEKFNTRRIQRKTGLSVRISPLYIEKFKAIYRSIRHGRYLLESLKHLFFINYQKNIRQLIKNCRGIICIANGELNSILRDFAIEITPNHVIIRNGINKSYKTSDSDRHIDILVCGRIEERKNQIGIIEACRKLNYNFFFIGNINTNNNGYGREFLKKISSLNNFKYIGSCSPEEIHAYYQQSKCHLSASYFEVSSLVDLESYYSGCTVISSENGYSNEILNAPGLYTVDPFNLEDIENKVKLALHSYSITGPFPREAEELTWEHAGQRLNDWLATQISNINS